MRRFGFPTHPALGRYFLIAALILPLLAGQSVYAVEQQVYIWHMPVSLFFQGSQDQVPIPTATITPKSTANIRSLPAIKGTEIVARAAKGSPYTVLGFVTREDGQWYYISLPEGFGWVRSDVVPAPEGDDLWDLTQIASLPVATDETIPGEQLIEAKVNLALIQSAFDTLVNKGVPSETFSPENIELIGIQGQNLIFRLMNNLQGNDAGTVLTIVSNGDALQTIELFQPGQLHDILAKNGIAANGEFSAAHTPNRYLRFGDTILFNYAQAASQLSQGVEAESALLSSVVVSDTAFPDDPFTVTEDGTQLIFAYGQVFDVTRKEGESFLRAKAIPLPEYNHGLATNFDEFTPVTTEQEAEIITIIKNTPVLDVNTPTRIWINPDPGRNGTGTVMILGCEWNRNIAVRASLQMHGADGDYHEYIFEGIDPNGARVFFKVSTTYGSDPRLDQYELRNMNTLASASTRPYVSLFVYTHYTDASVNPMLFEVVNNSPYQQALTDLNNGTMDSDLINVTLALMNLAAS